MINGKARDNTSLRLGSRRGDAHLGLSAQSSGFRDNALTGDWVSGGQVSLGSKKRKDVILIFVRGQWASSF
jgi:hypothetical protein